MVTRFLAVSAALVSAAAFSEQSNFDAFFGTTTRQPLVDGRGLSPVSTTALSLSNITSTEPRLGVPTFLWSGFSLQGASPRSQGLTAEQAARRYLAAHAELYRGSPSRWGDARLEKLHDLGEGAIVAQFQQRVQGTRVFRDEVKVVMTHDLKLVAIAGYLTPNVKPVSKARLSMESAVASAFQDLTGHGLELNRLKPLAADEAGFSRFALENERTPIRARPEWYAMPEGLEAAAHIELEVTTATGHAYFAYVISTHDGRVLSRHTLTAFDSYKYRVWADPTGDHIPFDGPQGNDPTPHPTGTPNGFSPPFVAPELVELEHGPISTNDPWLAPLATQTRGNNAFAYADLSRSNGFGTGDVVPSPSAPGEFDRVYDVALEPSSSNNQIMAATTQLFYNVNFFHDWYYDHGFDEAAGNGQTSNLGRGGKSNDALLAEAQDYSGTDNANMSTPSDGASPRMQMYTFTGATTASVDYLTSRFNVGLADYGPQNFNVTAELAEARDATSAPTLGCQTLTTNVTGKIAVVDRGTCNFSIKTANAQAAGAVGLIIVDSQNSNTPPNLPGNIVATIPTVSITRANGLTLKTAMMAGATSVTMQRTSAVDRDGTIDNSIVAHEWGHYISNRLVGDGNGLTNPQADGMGEGWADFHSMLMAVKESDAQAPANTNFNGVYAMAGYASAASDPQGYYFGIRRMPYSTDLGKNPLTFKHIQEGVALPPTIPMAYGRSGNGNSEVHATGEVWASMLWECYAALLRSSPRLTFTDARNRMMRYLVAAYKATPLQPTFVDARDAVLAVAAANDRQDFALFWQAFAKRGLGMGAVAPDRNSLDNIPVRESFAVGNALEIVSVTLDDSTTSCDNDGLLDNAEAGKITVTVRNVGVGDLTQSTMTVTSLNGGFTFPTGNSATFGTIAPFATATMSVNVALDSQVGMQGATLHVEVADPSFAVAAPVVFDKNVRVNASVIPNGSTSDDVEAPMSMWTVGNDPNGNTGSDWRVFQASPTDHYWFGPNPSSPADTWLISPSIDVGNQPFSFTFKHRYDFEQDATTFYDGAVIELSANNGASWVDIGSSAVPGYGGAIPNQTSNPLRGKRAFVGRSPGYPAFQQVTVSRGLLHQGQLVKIRFRIGSDDAANAKGWEIDDIEFTGITNKPFSAVITDPNTCTNAAPELTIGPNVTVNEGDAVQLVGSATDGDGDVVTLKWTQKSGPLATTLMGANFTAPEVTSDSDLVFELTASDAKAVVGPLTQTVTVKNVPHAPVAMVQAFYEVDEDAELTITGNGNDVDGDRLTWLWSQVSGPAVKFTATNTQSVTLTTPLVDGDTTLKLQLVANDGALNSEPAVVEVLVHDTTIQLSSESSLGPVRSGCSCNTVDVSAAFGLLGLVLLRRRRH